MHILQMIIYGRKSTQNMALLTRVLHQLVGSKRHLCLHKMIGAHKNANKLLKAFNEIAFDKLNDVRNQRPLADKCVNLFQT